MTRPVPPSPAGRRVPERLRLVLLLLPALAVVGLFLGGGLAQAVTESLGRQPLLGRDAWSLDAYRAVAADPAVRASLVVTARVALLATALSLVLGTGLALLVHRIGARTGMTPLFQASLAVPHLVGALAIGLLLSPSGLLSRLAHAVGLVDEVGQVPVLTQDAFGWGIIAEYVWKETPFVAVVVLAALDRRAVAFVDVARTLGAGPVQRLRTVVLPALRPPLTATAVLVLTFTVASFEVPRLLGRPYPAMLSVETLERFRDPDLTSRPEAMALAVLLTLATVLVVVVALAYLRLTRSLAVLR